MTKTKQFDDLREFIERANELGLCKVIKSADWNLEICSIAELSGSRPDGSLLVFDEIKGYEPGYRVVVNFFNTYRLFCLAHDLPLETRGVELIKAWREKTKGGFKPVPPRLASNAPIEENVHFGDEINLWEFPVPKWHELDGGRYIGTGSMVILKDPDDGWVNLGTYRVQVHDRAVANIHISPGGHGYAIRNKYWSKGLSCPAAVVCGGEPLLWSVSASPEAPIGVSEYDYAGWLRGKPIEVIRGKAVDLPIPASAEIVLEGDMGPPGVDDRMEGPFGENQGYYAGGSHLESVFRVSCVLHRHNPIILGAPPLVMDYDLDWGLFIKRTAALWNELDRQVPNVVGVWIYSEARTAFTVVSIKQAYDGHAAETALAVAGTYAGTFRSRFIIIVDEDIDPSSISQVLWALGTRCDPVEHIDIVRGSRALFSDAILSPHQRKQADYTTSKAIIYACRPYHWRADFPHSIKSSPQALQETRLKWGRFLFGTEG